MKQFSIDQWCQMTFDKKKRPRRRAARKSMFGVSALKMEALEPRVLLAADLGIEAPAEVVVGQQVEISATYTADQGGGQQGSGAFADYFGATLFQGNIALSSPEDGVWNAADFEIIGAHSGQAAIETTTGIVLFDSLASEAGGNGDTTGTVRDAIETPTGVTYVGDSAGSFDTSQPTSWLAANEPKGGVGPIGTQVSGSYFGISEDGAIVGDTGDAVYGSHSNLPKFLPGGAPANVAVDISQDSNYIAGSFLWVIDSLGGYDVLGTSGFDFSASGGAPTWIGVETDATGAVFFAGLYFDLNTFEDAIGFWDEDGNFLGNAGSAFAELDVVNGDVVASVNGVDDAMLVRVRDMSIISIEALTGSKAFVTGTFAKDGALGLVLEDSTGAFVTVIETDSGGSGDPIIVDLLFDFEDDGTIDAVVESSNTASQTHVYDRVGTYNPVVIAVDQDGNELLRRSAAITVSSWTVTNVDGQNVLTIGANQQQGSRIRVYSGVAGVSFRVDRERGLVQADRVEIIGSPKADHVRSYNIDIRADLKAGNDVFTSIGHFSALVDMGAGNDFSLTRGHHSFVVLGDGRALPKKSRLPI